jgi:DNA repair exonuclease SbcCD nuclease subunit
MRFIHTADWQIGMRAVHAGGAAHQVRAARLKAAEQVCEIALQERADFLLLAGDTFENNSVDRQLVIEVAGILGSIRIPVFILPGNHDPLQPGCIWEHRAWGSASNVTVLRERRAIDIPGGTLLPCPTLSRRSQEDPTSWISAERTNGIRIIAAHGNISEFVAEDGGFPIDRNVAARTSADYVALGHWHSTLLFTTGPITRMAYSGTHETTKFGETDSGNVLIVDISSPGAAPIIKVHKTGVLRWERIGVGETITTAGRLADVARTLALMPNQDRILVDVNLSGLLFECDRDELPRIESACSRFLSARLDKTGLRPAPNDDDWVRHLPAGVVRTTAARLQQMASAHDENASIATQALLELYTFAREAQL